MVHLAKACEKSIFFMASTRGARSQEIKIKEDLFLCIMIVIPFRDFLDCYTYVGLHLILRA